MNKLTVFIILGLFISGCAATSKTVKPTSAPEVPAVVTQEKVLPEVLPVAEQPVPEVVPPPDIAEIVEKTPAQQQIGVSYSQITHLISNFIDIQPIEDSHGQRKFLGSSDNNLVTLEIMGEKDNVSQVSMRLIYSEDMEPINADLNNAMVLRFLRNAAPEFEKWPPIIKDMINKLHTMDVDGKEEDKISLNEKIVHILYDKDINSITVTVRPK